MHEIKPVTNLTRFEKLGVALERAGVKMTTIAAYLSVTSPSVARMLRQDTIAPHRHAPVSYTHLTLPTKRIV